MKSKRWWRRNPLRHNSCISMLLEEKLTMNILKKSQERSYWFKWLQWEVSWNTEISNWGRWIGRSDVRLLIRPRIEVTRKKRIDFLVCFLLFSFFLPPTAPWTLHLICELIQRSILIPSLNVSLNVQKYFRNVFLLWYVNI